MFSRRFRTPVLIFALFLGTLSSLYAQPPRIQGHRSDAGTPIQRELSSRILFQSMLDLLHALVAPDQQPGNGTGPGPSETEREGAGLCPNGRPRGLHPGNGKD